SRGPAAQPTSAPGTGARYSTATSTRSSRTRQACCLPSPCAAVSRLPTTGQAPPCALPPADDGPAHSLEGGEGDAGRFARSLPTGRQMALSVEGAGLSRHWRSATPIGSIPARDAGSAREASLDMRRGQAVASQLKRNDRGGPIARLDGPSTPR